jgi:DNA-directed RNA polymerase subunit H (RpoH/RPB5)
MPLIDVSVRCFCTLVKSVAKQRIQSAQEKQKRLLHMYRIQAQQLDRTEAQNQVRI